MAASAHLMARGWWWRRGVVALGLGVATNVAACWTLVLALHEDSSPTSREYFDNHAEYIDSHAIAMLSVQLNRYERWWYETRYWMVDGLFNADEVDDSQRCDALGALLPVEYRLSNAMRKELDEGRISEYGEMFESFYGWPLRCFQTRTGTLYFPSRPKLPYKTEGALRVGKNDLPYRPMWRGLAANSLAYAAAWFVILAMGEIGRARLRCLRGRCPRCAYDLAGEFAAGCPECGWGRESGERGVDSGEPE